MASFKGIVHLFDGFLGTDDEDDSLSGSPNHQLINYAGKPRSPFTPPVDKLQLPWDRHVFSNFLLNSPLNYSILHRHPKTRTASFCKLILE